MQQLTTNIQDSSHLPAPRIPTWYGAIVKRFGNAASFISSFKARPEVQEHCALHMRKAIEMEDSMPSLGRAVAVYGRDVVSSHLSTHLTAALITMGETKAEKIDQYTVRSVGRSMAATRQWPHLRYSTIIGFFHSLTCGEYKIYGDVTPRKIMECFNEYCENANDREGAIRLEIEREKAERERREHDARCISWEERRSRLGLPEGTTLVDWVLMGVEEERKKKLSEQKTEQK